MKRQSLVLLLGSLCAVSAALATTYVRVEKDGTKTYSDRPMPGGQPIDVQPAQTYTATPPGSVGGIAAAPRGATAAAGGKLPLPELHGHAGKRHDSSESESVVITVSTNPPLRPGRRNHDDRRRPARGSPELAELHHVARVSRHTYRGGERREPERQSGLQFHVRVPRHAAGVELPRTPAGRHAAQLTTTCTAGGLHGG